jgi:hypothetical protein
VIDNEAVAAKVAIALEGIKGDEHHANRLIVALSNKLYDDANFSALVVACYQQLIAQGFDATKVAHTICIGIVLAQGKDGFPAKDADPNFPKIPPGQLVS